MSLFADQIARKPELYPWARQFIKVLWDNPWSADKFNFSRDVQDFKTVLTDEEREVVVKTLSAISQIEVSVKTFWAKLGDNMPPMRDLGCVLANTETVHNYAYEKLLEVLSLEDVYEKNLKEPVIAGRVKYLRKHTHRFYSDSHKQYVYALILFTLFVENVSLFSQFYIMNWLNKNRNVFSNVNQQILYTKNEETIHALVGIKLVNTLRIEHPELFDEELEKKIVREATEAVSHEIEIIKWILGSYVGDEHLSVETLSNFLKYRMGQSISAIGFKSPFIVTPEQKSKFWWFEEEILSNNMVDFFNQHSVDYSKNNHSFNEEDIFDGTEQIYVKI